MSESDEGLVSNHLTASLIRKVQEVLLWRRPLPLLLIFIVVESIFIFVYKFGLNFFSTLLFLAIVYNVFRFVYDFAGAALDRVLFGSPLPADLPDQLNRIRPPDEVMDLVTNWEAKFRQLWQWFVAYVADPSWDRHLAFFGTLFVVLIITTIVGTFMLMVIIVHGILIVPGMSLNPVVREFVSERIRAIEAAAEPKQKTD
jgi:hypothetical protein